MEVEEAYRRFFPVIRERCRRVLSDSAAAQDVAQDTFVSLWRSGLTLSDAEQTLRWVYRTSLNLALDRLRRRQTRSATRLPLTESVAPDEALTHRQLLEGLAREVSGDQWKAAVLIRIDGLDQFQAAQVLGCTDRTIRRHLEQFDRQVQAFQARESV